MEIKVILILLVFIVQLSSSQTQTQNYQLRQLYYDGNDNVCHESYPSRKDIIVLIMLFNDRNQLTLFADGGTKCSELARNPWNTVNPSLGWSYFNYERDLHTNVTRINFNQTYKREYTGIFPKRPKSITANSTFINPVIIEDQHYQCEIIGDGKVQHYGFYERTEICKFIIKCNSLSEDVKEE